MLQVRPLLQEPGNSSPDRQATNQSMSVASQGSNSSQYMFEEQLGDVHSWEVRPCPGPACPYLSFLLPTA
jgi:hypothetical protein